MLKSLRVGVNLMGMKREHRLLDRLRELQMPLMIVWGALDPVFPSKHAQAAAEAAPASRLLFFPNAGHWPHMEEAGPFQRRGDGVPSWGIRAMTSERRTP